MLLFSDQRVSLVRKIKYFFFLGKTFINGLAQEYDEAGYDAKKLKGYISERDFYRMINQINDTLYSFYPCPICFCFGYCCCPCTLGLSFLIPYSCVRDAEKEVKRLLEEINQKVLHKKRLHIELKVACSTSWVIIWSLYFFIAWNSHWLSNLRWIIGAFDGRRCECLKSLSEIDLRNSER